MRRIICILVLSMASAALLTTGCSSTRSAFTARPTQEVVRKTTIGTDWQMYQIRLNLPSGSSFPLLLKLATDDKVDGYFYLERGGNIDFAIHADSPVYRSSPNATGQVGSDRFSFTASKEQGGTYILQFASTPNNTFEHSVVFLELVYPIKGAIFVPLATK